jgi:hypothetical protein
MVSIPALSEKDLADTIEGEHGVQVYLESPEGVVITNTVDNRTLKGFVRRSYKDTRDIGRGDKDTVTVNAPVVKLRLSSLSKIPATGEEWIIGIPENPDGSGDFERYYLDPKKPVEVNKGTGTIKLFLGKTTKGNSAA